MKTKNKLLISIVSGLLAMVGATSVPTIAQTAKAEETPTLSIVSNNLSYADSVYILYAVGSSGFDRETDRIEMLFWGEPQTDYAYGTQTYISTSTEVATVKGESCVIFYSDGLAAKEMTDDVFARAYVEVDGEAYYSDVTKYSVLEYVCTQKEKSLTAEKATLFDAMLAYGAAAQNVFDYNLDRLANDTYYKIAVENGTLQDGFAQGRYKMNDTLTLTADVAPEGKMFSYWENSKGENVGAEAEMSITVAGTETYTAVYERKTSQGLKYTLSSNGTYYSVTGKGTCKDTDLVIPSKYEGLPVTYIGSEAFSDCTSLTSVEIPNTVTSIGSYAFSDCTKLTSVVIPDSVTSIGSYAFRNCTKLTSVVIPDSVTRIYDHAFYHCDSLTSIVIPENVTSIGESVFYSCDSLTSIEVSENNSTYKSIDGNLYTKNGATLIQYAIGKTATSFTIPDSVTSIGGGAFEDRDSLTSMVIPDSVKSIGYAAFYGCDSLKSVEIGDGVTSIGVQAFGHCDNLTNLELGNSVKSIGKKAIEYCKSLTSVVIPDSVTSIGGFAFSGCNRLTSVEIPDSVTSIDGYAFYNCNRLTSVYYTGDIAGWCAISFKGSESNPLCNGADLYINGVLVTELIIPDGVTSIGGWAFEDCSSLTSVVIPDSVTSIGKYAFQSCSSLTSVVIPDSVTSIGDYAFNQCSSLTSVYCTGDIAGWCAIDFYSSPSNPLYYGADLYINGVLVTELIIPDSVTSIGNYAFNKCSSLTSVVIPDSVTSIGAYAFSGCSSLTSVEIPDSVTSIGSYAFSKCSSLTIYCETASQPSGWNSDWNYSKRPVVWGYTIPSKGLEYALSDDGLSYIVTDIGTCTDTEVVISAMYKGLPVTSIDSKAFLRCDNLTSLVLGNNITSIGSSAFSGCTGITSITFKGTIAQWNAIEKGTNWNLNVPATEVVCSDGTVAI